MYTIKSIPTINTLSNPDVKNDPSSFPLCSALSPLPTKELKGFYINIRSLCDHIKYNFIFDLLSSENPSFLGISETWLPDPPGTVSALCTPPGYSFFHHNPRIDTRGGGVALICISTLSPKLVNIGNYPSFESLVVQIKYPQPSIISVIYRRDKSSTVKVFTDHFTDFLSKLSCLNKPIFIIGDFNIHLNKQSNDVSNFLETLDIFNLKQFVTSPTHRLGNILDPIISSSHVSSLVISDPKISDHFLLKFNCHFESFNNIPPSSITISYRKTNDIKFPLLQKDLSSLLTHPNNMPSCPDEILHSISSSLKSTLDSHAPLITRIVRYRPQTKWFNDELKAKKRYRRACERNLHKAIHQNRPDIHQYQLRLKLATHSYFNAMNKARQDHSRDLISNSSNKPKAIFNIANKLLSTPQSISEPLVPSDVLADFFTSKILNIRSSISHTPSDVLLPPDIPQFMSTFYPTSADEVSKILALSNKTFSPLDPFPSKLVMSISTTLLPHLVHLFDCSLSTGIFPKEFKHAFIKPLLKKPSLDPESPSSYRPVSLLPFFSKILERLVSSRILSHMSKFVNSELFQSGFKEYHSTESALLCVTNDLRLSADSGRISLLILLDLSAAFDTLDHNILTKRLDNFIGLKDAVLSWFVSYLENRSYQVKQGSSSSKSIPVHYGVPQGSVLGPLLFRIYVLPLLVLLTKLGVSFHCYADDTQLYIPCTAANFSNSMASIKLVYESISNWLSNNSLKLNDSKSEIILIGSPATVSLCKATATSMKLGSSEINFSPTVKNLGVLFDESLSFTAHVQQCRKSSFFMLKNLARIRNHFDQTSFESLVHAFISSRLDYCNSLFINLPSSTINRLQSIQNFAARLVLRQGRFCHITPLLRQLHWLPVKDRIVFKTLLLTFKAIHFSQPAYLKSHLTRKIHSRSLRDQDHLQLEVPISHSARMGDRAFAIAAPSLWNALPFKLRNASSVNAFKSLLKTHLFEARFLNSDN